MWTFSQLVHYPRVTQKPEWAEQLLEDPRIVTKFQLLPRHYDEPFLYSYGVTTKKNYPEQPRTEEAGGMSFDASVALMKSAGEAAERFSLTRVNPANFSYGRFSDVSPTLCPEEFRFYSQQQVTTEEFQCFKWADNDPFAWTPGSNLVTGEDVELPAQLVYMYDGHENKRPERLLFPVTSTGAACGWTPQESTLSAMLECLERDAFMVHYLSRTQGLRIDLRGNALFAEIEDYLGRFKLKLQVYLLQTDFPVCPVLALITEDYQDDSPSPWMASGLKCNLNPERAILGAIEEACQTRLWLRSILLGFHLNGGMQTKEMLEDVIVDRALYWNRRERIQALNFFTQSKRIVPFDSIPTQSAQSASDGLQLLLEFCQQRGHSVYRSDITAPEVREHGLVVSRVVMPTLQQFYLMEPYLPLGVSRWQNVPYVLGLCEEQPYEPNPVPHFFL